MEVRKWIRWVQSQVFICDRVVRLFICVKVKHRYEGWLKVFMKRVNDLYALLLFYWLPFGCTEVVNTVHFDFGRQPLSHQWNVKVDGNIAQSGKLLNCFFCRQSVQKCFLHPYCIDAGSTVTQQKLLLWLCRQHNGICRLLHFSLKILYIVNNVL